MTLQWKRNCKLTIQLDQSEPKALDLSEFKITFQVSQPTTEQPKAAEIYIYNLSSETMNLLAGVDSQKINTHTGLAYFIDDRFMERFGLQPENLMNFSDVYAQLMQDFYEFSGYQPDHF